jgi:hypothetical protein
MKRSPANGLATQLAGSRLSRRGLLQGAAAGTGALALGGATRSFTSAQEGAVAIFASTVDIPNIDPAIGHDGAISVSQKQLYDTQQAPEPRAAWQASGLRA